MKRVRTPADVKAARLELGMTQPELARALRFPDPDRMGVQTIARWEKGRNERGVPGVAQVAIEALLTGWRPCGFKA